MSEQIKFGDRLFLKGEKVLFDNGLNDAIIESRNGTLVIRGNLTVEGTTTTVNTEETTFADPYITLNSDWTGPATQDVGFEINRGDDPLVRFTWDETNDRWSFEDKDVSTTGDIYGNFVFATLSGNISSDNGVIFFDSTGDGIIDARGGNIDNTVIGATTAAAGYFTTIAGDGTDITNVLTNYTTDDLVEGTTNLYYTDERVDDRVAALFNEGYGLTSNYDDNLGTYLIEFDAQNIGNGVEVLDLTTTPQASFRSISVGNITNGGNSDLTVSVIGDEIVLDTAIKINQLAFNSYTGNGGLSQYTLPYSVDQDWQVLVYIDGVVQEPTVSYTITGGNTVTLNSALPNGSIMNVIRLATNAASISIGDADTLDGQTGSYYLDYNNFTNTPTIPTYSAGTGVDITSEVISIGQDVSTTSTPTFASVSAGTIVLGGGTSETTLYREVAVPNLEHIVTIQSTSGEAYNSGRTIFELQSPNGGTSSNLESTLALTIGDTIFDTFHQQEGGNLNKFGVAYIKGTPEAIWKPWIFQSQDGYGGSVNVTGRIDTPSGYLGLGLVDIDQLPAVESHLHIRHYSAHMLVEGISTNQYTGGSIYFENGATTNKRGASIGTYVRDTDASDSYFSINATTDTNNYEKTLARYDLSDDAWYFNTSDSTRLFIDATGNVGIGTTPTTALDVSGTITTSGLSVSGTVESNLIPNADNTLDLGSPTNQWKAVYGHTIEATYADLAERYEADSECEVGSVVVFGGDKEITLCKKSADVSVAGVISTDPALKMNSDAGPDETHPYVALRGRVPCKVVGPVRKGDLLVTSSIHGYAKSVGKTDAGIAVFAKSLQEDLSDDKKIIEVVII